MQASVARITSAVLRFCLIAVWGVGGIATPASAATIAWTDWSMATPGPTTGFATGTMGMVTVSYSGEVLPPLFTNTTNLSIPPFIGPSWLPATTFSGGPVDNPPPTGKAIGLAGGPLTGTNTLTFSEAVVDPVMAIWSLGNQETPITYVFDNNNFAVVAGGPSAEFGGSSIVKSAPNTVQGAEGNGVIQFSGTFASIAFTAPTFEFFHRFTVGMPATVPEPGTLALLSIGLASLGFSSRKRAK